MLLRARYQECLGKFESLEESRVASHEIYTRPEVLKVKGKSFRVPKVLLSGNHAKMDVEGEKAQQSYR
jgi:tRNA G37 N-methylase TrmD